MKKIEETNPKDEKQRFFPLITLIGILLLLAVGLFGLIVANSDYFQISKDWKAILDDLSIGMLVVGLLSAFDRYLSKRSFLIQNKKSLEEVIDSRMPQRLINLRDSGLANAQIGFDINDFTERLKEIKDKRIIINTIWVPDIHRICNDLIDAINNRGCSVQVLILDPTSAKEVIQKRSSSLRYSAQTIDQKIRHTLEVLKLLMSDIHDQSRFEVKVHNSFISASILGLGDTVWLGLYLDGRIATEGLHLKICGEDSPIYADIQNHFEIAWEKAPDFNIKDFQSQPNSNNDS
ncbi:MAG: hypothetical protein Roseis2KO_60680 [Roseivirga sp.]